MCFRIDKSIELYQKCKKNLNIGLLAKTCIHHSKLNILLNRKRCIITLFDDKISRPERPRNASCHWIFRCHSRSLNVIQNDTRE